MTDVTDRDKWFGQKDFGKILVCDFDGVIARYDGWKGPEVFGTPIDGAVESLQELKSLGWTILIFTSRLVTPALLHYFDVYKIPADDINGIPVDTGTIIKCQGYQLDSVENQSYNYLKYWRSNPEWSGIKPIGSVILDDMNFENEGKNYTKEKWQQVVESLKRRFP